MLCLPRLGLIFRVVMSANHEISDSDIFLELSVIVMKYSFKFNKRDPLCKKMSKKIHCDFESGKEWDWLG